MAIVGYCVKELAIVGYCVKDCSFFYLLYRCLRPTLLSLNFKLITLMAIHIYIHTFLHTCIGAIALHRGDLEQGRKYLNTAVGLFLSMQKRGVKGDYRTFAHAEALLGAALCQGECWPIYVYVSICLCV